MLISMQSFRKFVPHKLRSWLGNLLRSPVRTLRAENDALRAQLASVGLEVLESRDRLDARSEALTAENDALKAQLANVSLELLDARSRLQVLGRRELPGQDPAILKYRDRQSLILLPRLIALLEDSDRFLIVDGGAREVDRDPRWRPFPPKRLKLIGFEPDEAEAQRLNSTPGPGGLEWQFIPAGLWSFSGRMRFEHNKASGGSSFLTQNRALTDRWKFENPTQTTLARDTFFPTAHEDMPVVSLADWAKDAKINSIDFLKLNVQGGELEILRGAADLLDGVLGVLIEISFVESYKDRAMFSDVHRFLAARHFAFFDLLAHHYVGRSTAPIAAQHLVVAEPKLGQLVSQWGQLVEGHALFLRDPLGDRDLQRLDVSRVVKLAAFAEAFGQIEFAFELLNWIADRDDVIDTPLATTLRDLITASAREYEDLLSYAPSSRIAAQAGEHPE
jgi:FkbM family methyltransferase